MSSGLRNAIVVGGSYVGLATAEGLANTLPATYRVLLIEPHTHFHHLFAFPRFAVLPQHEHKAFIPYTSTFASSPHPEQHAVVRARATQLHENHVVLDRPWQGSAELPFDYLVVATGSRLRPPGTMEHDDKPASVRYLRAHQARVRGARSVAVVGGGALGVQVAADLKELHPGKEVTLVHSRDRLMPAYHERLDGIVRERFAELGVKLLTGSRVVMPADGFSSLSQQEPPPPTTVHLENGTTLTADLVIPAVGQTPNTQFLSTLPASSSSLTVTNPGSGWVRVRPTLQLEDPRYPHLYAVGDAADTGAHKAARPGVAQAQVAVRNVLAMAEGREPREAYAVGPAGIHLTLGLTKNVIFRNPDAAGGAAEPTVVLKDDGRADMGVDGIWARRGITVNSPDEYHL